MKGVRLKKRSKSQEFEYQCLTSKDRATNKILFLPVGSIESHGSSLPLGTDLLITQAFAHVFACKVKGLILPAIPYGFCPNTAAFKGTISPGAESLFNYLKEVCLSLKDSKVIILNMHKGNDAVIKMAVDDLFHRYKKSVYYINPYTFLGVDIDHEIFTGKDNSYKEACLLQASLKILHNKIFSSYISSEDEIVRKLPNLEMLRHEGMLGFSYPTEKYHIAGRKNADINKGMKYFKMAEEKIEKLVKAWRNLSKR